MVDVPGSADDDGRLGLRRRSRRCRRRMASASRVVIGGLDGPEVEHDGVVDDSTDHRGIARSERGEWPLWRRARRARTAHDGERLAGQRPAADGRFRASDPGTALGLARRASALGPRGPSTGVQTWRQTGISACATPARYSRSVAARAARMTLSGRIARASGSFRSRSTSSDTARDDPRLRSTDELVAREGHEVGACLPGARRASARGPARSARCRAAPRSRGRRRRSRRAGGPSPPARQHPATQRTRVCAKFEGWTRSTSFAGRRRATASKSADAGAVRRSHLDQARARASHRSPGSGRRRRSRRARRATRPRHPVRQGPPPARRPRRCCS